MTSVAKRKGKTMAQPSLISWISLLFVSLGADLIGSGIIVTVSAADTSSGIQHNKDVAISTPSSIMSNSTASAVRPIMTLFISQGTRANDGGSRHVNSTTDIPSTTVMGHPNRKEDRNTNNNNFLLNLSNATFPSINTNANVTKEELQRTQVISVLGFSAVILMAIFAWLFSRHYCCFFEKPPGSRSAQAGRTVSPQFNFLGARVIRRLSTIATTVTQPYPKKEDPPPAYDELFPPPAPAYTAVDLHRAAPTGSTSNPNSNSASDIDEISPPSSGSSIPGPPSDATPEATSGGSSRPTTITIVADENKDINGSKSKLKEPRDIAANDTH